jgi:hypothetical protein
MLTRGNLLALFIGCLCDNCQQGYANPNEKENVWSNCLGGHAKASLQSGTPASTYEKSPAASRVSTFCFLLWIMMVLIWCPKRPEKYEHSVRWGSSEPVQVASREFAICVLLRTRPMIWPPKQSLYVFLLRALDGIYCTMLWRKLLVRQYNST